jgi:uncharacterized protein (DUF1778 family)
METTEEKGARVNLRLTDGQYSLMKKLGAALGIELDSQCAKHFFLLGLQSSMSTLATSQAADMVSIFKNFALQAQEAEQTDLIEQAAKAKKR